MGGIGNYTAIAEMAWNQGDSLYGWLDNRILKRELNSTSDTTFRG